MTAKWAAYRVVSYRIVSYRIGLESRDIDTVYKYLLLLDNDWTRVSASLFARYLRDICIIIEAHLFLDTLVEFRAN